MKGKRRPSYERAVAALLSCGTVAEAARVLNMSEITLWRWLQDPEFQQVFQEARQQAVAVAAARLLHAAPAAAETLEKMMAAPRASVPSKVAAARTVLQLAFVPELEELKSRLDAFEDVKRQQQSSRKGNHL